ncbi:MAG: N-acetylmuramoyl-L-alanine amidase [Bacteroidales bacterium]|nr:N-acetylmuramoyl-L-alanine amidase [Bacteroidales bacterium]
MKILLVFSFFLSFVFVRGQVLEISPSQSKKNQNVEVQINDFKLTQEGGYYFKLASPISFNSFGIGWRCFSYEVERNEFLLTYRVHKKEGKWDFWKNADAFVTPEETPTGLFWTDLLFGIDMGEHDSIEAILYAPVRCKIEEIRISFQFVPESNYEDRGLLHPSPEDHPKSCPAFPSYIGRSGWCGSNNACLNPTYTITYINPTHTVVHHGASPNTYTDGAAVVYSYWNYHVNTLGWSDIGYNYLFDKYGNMYQGRHNPNYLNPSNYRDVKGAHAGASNSYSIGINFLGNADVTVPTAVQLDKCAQFLAWWYHHYGFDPTSSASIVLQSGGTGTVKRICGHRDVNVGGTTCPGDTLYNKLSFIRTETKNKILACSQPSDNIPPATTINIDGNVLNDWRGNDFWVEFDDYDNPGGSGIDTSFFQVIEYNGTEWRCNAQHGMFNDNFNGPTIHPDWTIVSGNWSIDNGRLKQSDESLTNPNIYASLTQTSQHVYLYQYAGRIEGTGTNRRFGFFFFASDATQTYRGNAYMVYFRADGDNVEIYKSTNNSISGILAQGTYVIDPNVWYDFKVTYNPSTGTIKVYVNNTFVVSWTDPNPLTSGNYISLRTGGCIGIYDDFKVRVSRDHLEFITVGSQSNKMIRYQSPTKSQEACRINTVVLDKAKNWSNVVIKNVKIDWTRPTTQFSVSGWQTSDFIVNFQDSDNVNGSGVSRRFYQARCWNGNKWTANSQAGFIYDDINSSSLSSWTVQTGTWIINNGDTLVQTDESLSNTNIWTYLKQDLSNRYLYEFDMKIEGSGTNIRAGFHYMSDSASLTNRGNSYFVWFRIKPATQEKYLEFYKVYNDVFEQVKVLPCNIQLGKWYNVKIIFDRITGETFVYLDDVLVGEWKDDAPFSTGKYISFRSGNSRLSINNVKVYRTRYPQVTISTQGNGAHILYDNINPSTPGAKIVSLVTDSAHNISLAFECLVNVDLTSPVFSWVRDGINIDVDTLYDSQVYSASWEAQDPNSGISQYWFALGTAPGLDDVITWASTGTLTQITIPLPSLVYGQRYYASIRALNGAGKDSYAYSDGFVYWTQNLPQAAFHPDQDTVFLPNATVTFINESQNATTFLWDFGDGQTSTQVNPVHTYTTSGSYTVSLIASNSPLPSDTLVVPQCVTVLNSSFVSEFEMGIYIYPIPFEHELSIRFEKPFSGKVSLYDMIGQIVFQDVIDNRELVQVKQLASLSEGQYMLLLQSSSGDYTRVLIQKIK